MHSFRGAFCRFCREKRHADGFGAFNFAMLVFLLLARHSPQAVSARAACVGCHQKYRESRDDVAGVLYLFSAKRYPKTPRQMPSPTSSRLTLAPGARLKGGFKGRWAAERIISDTTLSLLKPASYAGARAFSRAFVSRLRHRAGIVRRGTRREEVQNGPFRNLKPRFLTGRRTGRRAGRSCQSQCKSRFLTGRTREQGRTPLVRMFARSQVKRIFKSGPAAAIGGNPPRPAPSRGRTTLR